MKKLNTVFLTLVMIGAGFLQVNAQELPNQNDTKLEPVTPLQTEINETENLYLELSDRVISAIDNYNAGKISEEVYLEIMGEIKVFLDDEQNYNKMKEDELSTSSSNITPYATSCTTGGGKEEVYLYFDKVTGEEIALFAAHPIKSAEAKTLSTTASEKANSLYAVYTLWQGNGDAFRHAYWSALMTKNIDRDYAYDAGLAHEGLKRGYNFDAQGDDTKMDISNNYSGRILGDANSSLSDSQLATVIKNETTAGNLKRIRTYTSDASLMDCVRDGVMTKYVGYYVPTSNGGLK